MRGASLLLLLAAAVSLAGPPLSGPAEIPRDTVGVLTVSPKGTLKLAVPAGLSVVKTPQAWYVAGAPGKYRFVGEDFWIDWDKKEFGSEPVDYTLTVTGDAGPAPPPGPVDPPVTPPTTSLYFLVIRPDGPASPEFTRVMQDPAWLELLAKGHTFKDKTVTEARSWGYTPPAGTTLPVVPTLRTAGGKSVIARGPVALPTTGDGIRGLPAGVP